MHTVTTIAELRAAVAAARDEGLSIGLVPTMGALHDGHLSLVRRAGQLAGYVVATIFVNPTQFGEGEDLAAYPRDLPADEAALASLGEYAPDLIFAPEVDEVYPRRGLTTVRVDELGDRLCGRSRPTHFDGVTTVVAKLLNMAQPDVAVFGRKDFQQLTLIRRMVEDLNLPVHIEGAPIVRERDGVAMSSRNRYLDADNRLAARVLSRSLRAGVLQAHQDRARAAAIDVHAVAAAVTRTLQSESRARVDYVELLGVDDLAPLDHPNQGSGEANVRQDAPTRLLVAVAAHVGPARLIDNVVIGDPEDEDALLAATSDPA